MHGQNHIKLEDPTVSTRVVTSRVATRNRISGLYFRGLIIQTAYQFNKAYA